MSGSHFQLQRLPDETIKTSLIALKRSNVRGYNTVMIDITQFNLTLKGLFMMENSKEIR